MVDAFIEAFTDAEPALLTQYQTTHPGSYDSLFSDLVRELAARIIDDYGATPDPERITVIDHGDYQGSRVFIVGSDGYQPSRYWGVVVSYGSCSGCDTFEAIRYCGGGGDDAPTEDQARQYLDLVRHMVQGLRPIHSDTW